MKLHPTSLTTTKPGRELGRQIAALRYDLLEEVIIGMTDELERQAYHDAQINRPKLARYLRDTAIQLYHVQLHIGGIMQICEPFIKAEKRLEVADFHTYKEVNQGFTGYKLQL